MIVPAHVQAAQEEFQEQCVGWEDDFRLAGIRATHFNCPNTRCVLVAAVGHPGIMGTHQKMPDYAVVLMHPIDSAQISLSTLRRLELLVDDS